jgi:hypothetical protein
MLTEEIMKKLKDAGIVAEDLTAINEAYQKKLEEQTSLKVEEQKVILEAANKVKLEEAIATKTAELEAEYATKLEEAESEMLEGFDRFVESQIEDKIGPELIEASGINEANEKVIQGIRSLFETEYVALDVEGAGLLKKNELALESRDKELSESIAKNMVLAEELDKVKKDKFLSESTGKLTESQKTRVISMFEGKNFKETSEKLEGFVKLLVEEKPKAETKEVINENKDSITTGDKILAEDLGTVKVDTKAKNINLSLAESFL